MNFLWVMAEAMGASEGAFYAYDTSDGVGKGIVLLLLAGSVITWSIMVDKFLSLRRAQQLSERFIAKFRKAAALGSQQLWKDASTDPGPVARVYAAGADKLFTYTADNKGAPLTVAQREAIRTVLDNAVSDQILSLEERVPWLALAVSASPFFGLFGTVWGVMLAFCGAAKVGRADIAALAPGVAGALLTTVVGLVVAIPSLIGYNILTGSIRKTTTYMDSFVEEFMTRLGLEQIELNRDTVSTGSPRGAAPGYAANPDYSEAQVVMPLKSVLAAAAPQPQVQVRRQEYTAPRENFSSPIAPAPQTQNEAPAPQLQRTAPPSPVSPLQPRVIFDGREIEPRQSEMPIGNDGSKR